MRKTKGNLISTWSVLVAKVNQTADSNAVDSQYDVEMKTSD